MAPEARTPDAMAPKVKTPALKLEMPRTGVVEEFIG
jgi:hypothetical protein